MHRMYYRTRLFGHYAQHIPVRIFIMKENLDLLIEDMWRKRDEFTTFISAIEKLPSPHEKKLALPQGNEFIDVYKTLFDKHYGRCIKELLPISIVVTPETDSTFSWWYLSFTEPDKTYLNIGICDVHKLNMSKTKWKTCLDSLSINPKAFDRYPIVSHKS